jgi:hypothetical protein
MIHLNKYLKEIGIDENYWLFKDAKSGDKRYLPDEEGFVPAEFWNLDATLAMCIYSYLCYFKEYCNVGYPGHMTEEQWNKCLDNMITAFRLLIEEDKITDYQAIESKNRNKKINYGLRLFAKYFRNLWY